MAGALHGVLASLKAAAAAATDTFFRYVSLLLNTTSTNGAQNNTFLDGSTNAFSITRNGNTTQGTFSPFSQTGWSNYFDGNGDFLTAPDNAALNMGTSDFTLEAWIYLTATPGVASPGGAMIINKDGQNAVSWAQYHLAVTSGLKAVFSASAVPNATVAPTTVITGVTTLALNTWYHVAVTRVGANATLWVNGVSDGTTAAVPANLTNGARPLYIGYENGQAATYYFPGYISNARVVKGTAVYTANFTPPTSPLTAITNTSLLTCQSNRFIDNSSNAFAITRNGDVSVQAFSPFAPTAAWSASTNGGSGYFDGTGDYLTVPDNAAFDFGSGDFTVELWYYPQATPSETTLISKWNTGTVAGTNQWLVYLAGATTAAAISTDGTNAAFVATGPSVVLNQWNHIAFVRNGNSFTVYTNGVGGTPVTNTGTLYALDTEVLGIGYRRNSLGPSVIAMQGYASQVRIVKGTAVYTANFTPPTAPLTAITNTSLLLNFTNAGIYDSASGNDLETVGNAQVSTVQAKWGTTSMAFDGTGDWLVVPNAQGLRFGAANFTIELWYYPTNVTGVRQIFNTSSGPTGAVNTSYALITNGTSLLYYLSSTGTSWDIASGVSGGTVALNTWHHIALVRNGSTFNVYLNGTAGTSTTSSASLFAFTSPLGIGADLQSSPTPIIGYIDDLRITNGVARYTSNFTAPTAAFPLQ